MLRFIPLLHALSPGLVLFPRNVRACGCPKMFSRTRPLGHRPRFYSSVTSTLLADYGCKEVCAPPQSQAQAGASGGLSSQDGDDAQQQEAAPLLLPQLLHIMTHQRIKVLKLVDGKHHSLRWSTGTIP